MTAGGGFTKRRHQGWDVYVLNLVFSPTKRYRANQSPDEVHGVYERQAKVRPSTASKREAVDGQWLTFPFPFVHHQPHQLSFSWSKRERTGEDRRLPTVETRTLLLPSMEFSLVGVFSAFRAGVFLLSSVSRLRKRGRTSFAKDRLSMVFSSMFSISSFISFPNKRLQKIKARK